MPKVTHTATGPNGETFKRTSTSRRYSHVIIGRPSRTHAVERAQAAHDRALVDYADNVERAANGSKPAAWMVGKPHYDQKAYPGQELAAVFRAEGKAKAQAWLASKPATAEAYAAQVLADRQAEIADQVERGVFDRFVALSWSSRLDLAQREAGRADWQRAYVEVQPWPVDPA